MKKKFNNLTDYSKGFISAFDFTGTSSEIKKVEPELCESISFIAAINNFGNNAVNSSKKAFQSVELKFESKKQKA